MIGLTHMLGCFLNKYFIRNLEKEAKILLAYFWISWVSEVAWEDAKQMQIL